MNYADVEGVLFGMLVETQSADRKPEPMQLRLAAIVLIALPNALVLLTACSRANEWWPASSDISHFPPRPWLEVRLILSVLVAILGNLIIAANFVHHATLRTRTPWRTNVAFALCAAWTMPTPYSFIMPSENPYDGTGAPFQPCVGIFWLLIGGATAGACSLWLLRQTLLAPRAPSSAA